MSKQLPQPKRNDPTHPVPPSPAPKPSAPKAPPRLLRTHEVAEYGSCHKDTVLLAARRGLLVSIQADANCTRRYRLSDVDAWIERGMPTQKRRRYLRTA